MSFIQIGHELFGFQDNESKSLTPRYCRRHQIGAVSVSVLDLKRFRQLSQRGKIAQIEQKTCPKTEEKFWGLRNSQETRRIKTIRQFFKILMP